MDSTPPPVPKKGLGPLAWLGIGCGGLIVLLVVGVIAATMMFGGKIKQLATEAQENPTRLAATTMVSMGAGKFEMVAEDDVNKRYTVRQKEGGKLTTLYWNPKTQAPEAVDGDFSAIPQPEASSSPVETAETP